VEENAILTDIFELVSDASIPIAVVDEKQRMKGIIVKGALIGALAGNDRYINAHSDHEPAHETVVQEVR
jgi:glycine betaine/proline transport system ATP-binding protein